MKTNYLIVFILSSLLAATVLANGATVKVIGLFTNKALFQIDGEQKLLSKGETFKGVTLQSSSARGAVISIDGKSKKLQLNQGIQQNYKAPVVTPTRIYPDLNGMYFSQGEINDKPVRFLVDTGASNVTMSSKIAKRIGLDYTRGLRGIAQTASSIVEVKLIKLDTVKVGTIVIRNVEASVIEGDLPSEVLLGNSFLKHTRLERIGTLMELEKRFK